MRAMKIRIQTGPGLRMTADMAMNCFDNEDLWAKTYRAYKTRANENRKYAMTGNTPKDTATLARKWGLDADQMQYWAESWSIFSTVSLNAASPLAHAMTRTDIPNPQAVITAAAMGMMHQVFGLIKNLEPPEARFVLEQMTKEQQLTIEHLRGIA